MQLAFAAMTPEDWPAVQRVYAEGIATGLATFESAPPMKWEDFIRTKVPECSLVARDDEGSLAGWATLSPISARAAYRGVAEATLYIAASHRARRVGDRLMRELIRVSEQHGFWTLQSSTFPQNLASVALQQRHGFHIVGIRERIAKMTFGPLGGQWCDTLLLERRSKKVGVG
jgi:L-amino acid N-acyltransferase YncA